MLKRLTIRRRCALSFDREIGEQSLDLLLEASVERVKEVRYLRHRKFLHERDMHGEGKRRENEK